MVQNLLRSLLSWAIVLIIMGFVVRFIFKAEPFGSAIMMSGVIEFLVWILNALRYHEIFRG